MNSQVNIGFACFQNRLQYFQEQFSIRFLERKMAKYSPQHPKWERSLFLLNIRVNQKSFIVEVQRVPCIFPCYQVQKSPTNFVQKERTCLGGFSRCLKFSGPLIWSKKLQTPGGTSKTCPSRLNFSRSFVDLEAWENAFHPFDLNTVIVDSPNKH